MLDEYEDLIIDLKQEKKVAYLFGAGFSMALGNHRNSWSRWIAAGRDFLDAHTAEKLDACLKSPAADALIDAAGFLLEGLKETGCYDRFMQATIESLKVEDETLGAALVSINRCGDMILTTNYDSLIEQATEMKAITYSDSAGILRIINGDAERKVIHLHGAYDSKTGLDDIVADRAQYDDVTTNKGAQFIQNLLSTYMLIIVGCGTTLEDPNLTHFINFITRELKWDKPYYYLHCSMDGPVILPENVRKICYGDSYEDLPAFFQSLAMLRIRNRIPISDFISVNPYIDKEKLHTPVGRMHYTNAFVEFIGRHTELDKLNRFADTAEQISFLVVTGEAGVGKSRLLYEWIKRLPCSWYGFFVNTKYNADRMDGLERLFPFADTVVVMDYIQGNEENCRSIFINLCRLFRNSRHKLRIVLLERRYDKNKLNWYSVFLQGLTAEQKMEVQRLTYNPDETGAPNPLQIKGLSKTEEIEYVQKYLDAYRENMPPSAVLGEELSVNEDVPARIQQKFHTSLRAELCRPLFLSIFIEVWIYKKGIIRIENAEELLTVYMEKEESRWFNRVNKDQTVLNAYLKLLALACAIEVICVNEDNGCFNQEARLFCAFLDSEKRTGRKKWAIDEFFVHEELKKPLERSAEHGAKAYILMEPEYPDILREFIVNCYLDEAEWTDFTKTARDMSTFEFANFIIHALEDFPDNQLFQTMQICPPDRESDYLEYYVSLLARPETIMDYAQVAVILRDSSVSGDYHLWELELWRRMAIVLGRKDQIKELTDVLALLFKYLDSRMGIKDLMRSLPDVLEAFEVELYNREMVAELEWFATECDRITDKVPDDTRFATFCAEASRRLFIHHMRQESFKCARRDWQKIYGFAERFPNDEDIAEVYAETAKDWVCHISHEHKIGQVISATAKVAQIYGRIHKEQIAGAYMTCLGNEFACRADVTTTCDWDGSPSPDRLLHIERTREIRAEAEGILAEFPENENVVMGYTSIIAAGYLTSSPVAAPTISEQDIERFRLWSEKYRDNYEITDDYVRLLIMKASCLLLEEKTRKEGLKILNLAQEVLKNSDNVEMFDEDKETIAELKMIYRF